MQADLSLCWATFGGFVVSAMRFSSYFFVSTKSPFQDGPSDGQFSRQGYSQIAQVLAMEKDVDLNLMKERETAIYQLEVRRSTSAGTKFEPSHEILVLFVLRKLIL